MPVSPYRIDDTPRVNRSDENSDCEVEHCISLKRTAEKQKAHRVRFMAIFRLSHALASDGVNFLGAIAGPSLGRVRVSHRRANA